VDFTLKGTPQPVNREAESRSNLSSLLEKLRNLYQPPGKVHYQAYQKLEDSPWVKKALTTERVKFYYWFAQFPVVKSVNSKDGRHRVEFMGVRFLIPSFRLPFVYYVEFDDSGKIQSEGFLEDWGKGENR